MLRAVIVRCRERLPAKPREALDARLAESGGDPDAALAERLGMKKNTFLQNFTRARTMLAECLEKNGVDLATELP
jgi:RNA polymerase sigma-70 factor (ECF subfamily)